MNQIFAWRNFLSHDEMKNTQLECENYYWKIAGWSQFTPETRVFWFKDLLDSKYIVDILSSKVEESFNRKIQVNRLYANGQSHGQCGMFHRDVELDQEGDYYSLVYYSHKNWLPEYGGHLMIKTENNIESYWPESNSAIMFNSKLEHCPLEPTVFCKTQRESIAFKFKML